MKLVAREMGTGGPATSGHTSTRLPDDLPREQLGRLALFSAVAAGLWTFGLLMNTVFVPLSHSGSPWPHWTFLSIDILGLAVSVAMFAYVR